MDQLFFLDMQKDTVVNTIGSIMLDLCWTRWRICSSTSSVR